MSEQPPIERTWDPEKHFLTRPRLQTGTESSQAAAETIVACRRAQSSGATRNGGENLLKDARYDSNDLGDPNPHNQHLAEHLEPCGAVGS